MGAVAEAAFEAVGVEQRHEQLEVLLLASMRRRRHQQEVAAQRAQKSAQAEPASLFDLRAEPMGRHPVRLVDHDQVPLG